MEYATKNNVKKFGINKLLDTGIYKAAFPLHDVSPVLVAKIHFEIEETFDLTGNHLKYFYANEQIV